MDKDETDRAPSESESLRVKMDRNVEARLLPVLVGMTKGEVSTKLDAEDDSLINGGRSGEFEERDDVGRSCGDDGTEL